MTMPFDVDLTPSNLQELLAMLESSDELATADAAKQLCAVARQVEERAEQLRLAGDEHAAEYLRVALELRLRLAQSGVKVDALEAFRGIVNFLSDATMVIDHLERSNPQEALALTERVVPVGRTMMSSVRGAESLPLHSMFAFILLQRADLLTANDLMLLQLTRLLGDTDEAVEAEELYREAIGMLDAAPEGYGEFGIYAARASLCLARLHYATEYFVDARSDVDDAVGRFEKLMREGDDEARPTLRKGLIDLAKTCRLAGAVEDANRWERMAEELAGEGA